jgi:large subunit ribosomal protein L22
MEVKAVAKYVRVQPRKVRIIADEVRGKNATHTVSLLRYHTGKGAKALHQVLVSAMANAQENHGISPEQLKISAITVDEGPRLKRMQARAMGRGNRIVKKTSHITVTVEDYEVEKPVKPHGTKAKPRPTFAVTTRRQRRGSGKAAEAAQAAEAAPAVEAVEIAAEPEAVAEAPVVEAAPEAAVEETTTVEPVAETAKVEAEASDEKGAE